MGSGGPGGSGGKKPTPLLHGIQKKTIAKASPLHVQFTKRKIEAAMKKAAEVEAAVEAPSGSSVTAGAQDSAESEEPTGEVVVSSQSEEPQQPGEEVEGGVRQAGRVEKVSWARKIQ
jgi:hypothetical protein